MKFFNFVFLQILLFSLFDIPAYGQSQGNLTLIGNCQELAVQVVTNPQIYYDTWRVYRDTGEVRGKLSYKGLLTKRKTVTFICDFNSEYIGLKGYIDNQGSFNDGFNPNKYIRRIK